MKRVMLNRDFFLLWTGRLVSQIGDKFYSIALAWWVLQKTNSTIVMGLLMTASVLPGLLIAPMAGTLIDRWYRKPVLITADIVRGVFVMNITGLSFLNRLEVWHVFVTAVVISLGSSFYDPTVQSVVPQIVSKEELPKANSLSQITGGISMVLGPVLGASAVSFFGFTIVFLINGLTYLVSALCGWLMTIPLAAGQLIAKTSLAWEDMKAGVGFLIGRKRITIIIGVIGITHFFYGSLIVTLPFLANRLAGNSVRNLGYLETMSGLGLILGSVFLSIRCKGELHDKKLFSFIMGLGASLLLIGFFQRSNIVTIIPYLVLMLIIGVVIANASIYWQSLLQLNVPTHMAGRIFSISAMMGNVSLPLAFGIFGLMLKFNSIMLLMTVSGITLILMSGALRISYKKSKV